MIPQLILDDEEFYGIVDKAVKQIPGLDAEWTDYNAHDPGITMLELLAWFKEMQQFHLDQMGDAHMRKCLKLLGIRPQEIRPAEAELRVDGQKERIFFPKGSRFFAGDICFETVEKASLDAARVVKLVSKNRERQEVIVTDKKLHFPAFGTRPMAGDVFGIGLDAPLTPGVEQNLFLYFSPDAPVKRNPIAGADFIPLAEYRLIYEGKEGRRDAEVRRDTTFQMLENGFLTFYIEERMEPGEDGLYWLYIILESSDYDLPPVIEDISLSRLRVRQICTWAESHEVCLGKGKPLILATRLAYQGEGELFLAGEMGFKKYEGRIQRSRGENGCSFSFPDLTVDEVNCRFILYEAEYENDILIGEGTGMPFQEYPVEIPDLCTEGFAVMVETGEGTGCYELWEPCGDFDASGPLDRHFHFEEETGILSFGDIDHGIAPEGKILLAAAHSSLGVEGNVKAGSICRSEREKEGVRCWNDREAAGGENRENLEQCRERMQRRLKEQDRAVTYEDFAYLAKQTPGLMIENVKAIPIAEQKKFDGYLEEETVSVVVKPYSAENRPSLSGAYQRNIENMLNSHRMIGTKIKVLSPEYIGIAIFAKIGTNIPSAMAKQQIRQVLEDFFFKIRADFGSSIQHSAVYGMIDVLGCVAEIKSFVIDAQGKNIRRGRNGDIFLPVNGLAYMKECNLIVVTDR